MFFIRKKTSLVRVYAGYRIIKEKILEITKKRLHVLKSMQHFLLRILLASYCLSYLL